MTTYTVPTFGRGFVKPAYRKDFGFIVPDVRGGDIHFLLGDGRQIGAGLTRPVFVQEGKVTRRPNDHDRVVFMVSPWEKPGVRSTVTRFHATVWGYEEDWAEVEVRIASRPVYRVVRTAYYLERVLSINPGVNGNLSSLKSEFYVSLYG